MKERGFSELEIIRILEIHRKGVSAKEVCETYNIRQNLFNDWRRKYAADNVSLFKKKIKRMERELWQYKQIVAELMLQNNNLKSLVKKEC